MVQAFGGKLAMATCSSPVMPEMDFVPCYY